MQDLISFLKNDLVIPEQLIPTIVTFYEKEQLAKDAYWLQEGQQVRKLCVIGNGYLRFFSYADKR